MSEATLLVIQGPNQGDRYRIASEAMRIGRGTQNQIRILDTEISRQHAVVSLIDDRWKLTDRNSSNGTFVNGSAVQQCDLMTGDQIQLGRTVLLFTEAPEVSSDAASQISLVPHSASEDASKIVGQADSFGSQAISNFSQAGANLQLLYQITEEAVRPTSSIDELLKRILDITLKAVGADRGCMLVTNSTTDKIEPRVVSHRPEINVDERMPVSTSIVEYVIQNGQGVRTSDAQHDVRFDAAKSILMSGIREAMCVPMTGRYELMGIIYVDTTNRSSQFEESPRDLFNDSLLRLLIAIGRQAALAIENSRFQHALVTAERLAAVGQTVAIMSHHIKNIMQGVRGGGYLVDMGLDSDNNELVRKGWGIVDRNQERILNLVMDMLTFSKERQPKLEPSNIEQVIDDVIELMQKRMADENIELQKMVAGKIPISMFDAEGMHRVILNIVTNAIEALAEAQDHGHIKIRADLDRAKSQLWVEIEDDGPGIEAADRASLFNLFESDKGARGTGLGLAVSRKILQEHGGDIMVKSSPGDGTCFRLEWPFHEDDSDRGENDGNGGGAKTQEFDILP